MQVRQPWEWDRSDLLQLLGQSENLRLEFKGSDLLSQERSSLLQKLTKEVSAFANSEGGTIVIGMSEHRQGRSRVASDLDAGVNEKDWTREKLQQTITGNVSPLLVGVRVHPVPLDEKRSSVAYVIYVPQGSTAYQATDRIYYGRQEYESVALPDHEVRLRMFRGKARSGIVEIEPVSISSKQEDCSTDEIRKQLSKRYSLPLDLVETYATSQTLKIYTYQFTPVIRNTGELNLTDFKLTISVKLIPNVLGPQVQLSEFRAIGMQDTLGEQTRKYSPNRGAAMYSQVNIFPQDRYLMGDRFVYLPVRESGPDLDVTLQAVLYLQDTQPIIIEKRFLSIFEDCTPTEA